MAAQRLSIFFGYNLQRFTVSHYTIRGGPKVSHYQESSLNRIKKRQCGYISHQF